MNYEELSTGQKKNISKYFRKASSVEASFSFQKEEKSGTTLKNEPKSTKFDKNKHIEDKYIQNKKFKAWIQSTPDASYSSNKAPGGEVTPLLQQYAEIKKNNPSLLLFIECGYKYRFFEKDAEIASRELNLATNIYHGLSTASIPTHRLHIHVKRLVKKGYKVGVVNQTEARAVKDHYGVKGLPFDRNLAGIYTRATLIGELVSPLEDDAAQISGPLLAILEENTSNARRKIAVVIINVALGQVFTDEFDDSSGLEFLASRLERYQPIEFLIPEDLSACAKMVIKSYISCQRDAIRLEDYNLKEIYFSSALFELSSVVKDGDMLKKLSRSKLVVCCLFAAYQYLKEFGLQTALSTLPTGGEYKHVLKLPAATLRNLEMVKNGSDHGTKFSLFWVLNRTETKFGARMLHSWIVNPLTDVEKIKERQDVIEELIYSDSHIIHAIKNLIQKLPDLESSLVAIFYKKCSPCKFYATVEGLSAVHDAIQCLFWRHECLDSIQSNKLKEMLSNILENLKTIGAVLNELNADAARQNKKPEILLKWHNFPEIIQLRLRINNVLEELEELRPSIAKTLNMEDISYSTFYAEDFLIAVKLWQCCFVPEDWQLVCSSKNLKRYRSPQVLRLYKELQQVRKALEVKCNEAWMIYLEKFLVNYYEYKSAVHSLATLDVLISMAKVSALNGYVKPMFNIDSKSIMIEEGKHPIVSIIKCGGEPFIANNTTMQADCGRVIILTGPNMGGKSCYMKQVALICIMAQIGCFIPAASATLPILDGVYVRMGASDELGLGRSTFMIEASETTEIINSATEKSLVILDEFGRGTSSCDGAALAAAVLQYVIQMHCFTIFVTHYTKLCEMESKIVTNYHMSYVVIDDVHNPTENIAFLYQLVHGRAESSYGLNVARLSGLPLPIVTAAADKARDQEHTVLRKSILMKAFVDVFTSTNNRRQLIENLPKF